MKLQFGKGAPPKWRASLRDAVPTAGLRQRERVRRKIKSNWSGGIGDRFDIMKTGDLQ